MPHARKPTSPHGGGNAAGQAAGATTDAVHGGRPRFLFRPVDVTPLVYFRILFGVMILWLGWLHFHGETVSGQPINKIEHYYIDRQEHFTYYGFEWVKPWPAFESDLFGLAEPRRIEGMYVHCFVVGLCAALVIVGLFYRPAALLLSFGLTYVFLLDQARYLNHYYLACLLALLLAFVPGNGKFSLDARFRPRTRNDQAPAWALWLFRIQLGVVYFFAGVAKVAPDWLHGEPVRMMLAYKSGQFHPAIGQLFKTEWFVYFIAYSGMLFDLSIFWLLIIRKTRWLALALVILFHASTDWLYTIDIFPWLMIGGVFCLFFPDKLPGGKTNDMHDRIEADPKAPLPRRLFPEPLAAGLFLTYVLVQLLLPLRVFLYDGDSNWTSDGRLFAWRMLTRDLRPAAVPQFEARFRKDGQPVRQIIPLSRDLRDWNYDWQLSKLVRTPDMIVEFSHLQAEVLQKQGVEDVEIRALIMLSLNGREPQLFIDPQVNLAAEPRRLFTPYPWVVPLLRGLPPPDASRLRALQRVKGREPFDGENPQ